MPAINLEQFGGMLPAWDAHLLPVGQASFAENGYLFSGSAIGWRKPTLLRALNDSAARFAYRVPTVSQAQARAYLVFKSQPNDGDTVTIGDLTYTWRTTLAEQANGDIGAPFEVLIGADVIVSAGYLGEAITADNGKNTNAGVHYGTNTPLNGDIAYVLPDTSPITGLTPPTVSNDDISGTTYNHLRIGAEDFGAAYNALAISESTGGVRTIWLRDPTSFAATTSTLSGGTNPTFDTTVTGSAVWLEFADPDTNVVKSPVVDDQFNRFYFASPSVMPKYNTYDRIQSGAPAWLLGVPQPGCAVTLDVTGGGNNLTLGNFTASEGFFMAKANRVYLMKIMTPGATQIQNVKFTNATFQMPDEGLPEAHWCAVVYRDFNGSPDTLVNTGEIITGVAAGQINTSTFVNPSNLDGDTDYWIGIMIDTAMSMVPGPATVEFEGVSWPNVFTNGPETTAPTTSLARSQITSDGANVSANDVVRIGGHTYTFKATVTGGSATAPEVLIGVDAAASLLNLSRAINASGGTPGTDYTAAATANTYVNAAAPASLAVVITLKNAALGDGSNVATTFTPSGTAHLSFPDRTLQEGYATGVTEFNMWSEFITSDVIEARSYVYTWVTEYGEEGPPSPPTLLDGWSNATWTLGLWQPPENDTGVLRNITKVNIYRTVPGQGGTTVFFYVDTVDVGTETFVDTAPNNTVALNDQLLTTNWFPPPEALQGLTILPNGMVAGFKGNEVWFCEPYHPHAWPPGYVVTTDFPIVGLGTTNGALVVCTAGTPYVLTGTAPASMAQVRCADPNPCLSRASILSGDAACTFMSPNGLIQVTAAGVATNTTDLWITRQKWKELVPQKNTRAVLMASCYFCLGSVSPDGTDTSEAQRGFTIELAQDNQSFSIWPHPGGHRLGLQSLDSPLDVDISNIYLDPWTGIALVIASGNVYYYDFADTSPELKVYTWTSKHYYQNAKRSYSAFKVSFTIPAGTPTQNETRLEEDADHASWATLPTDRYGYFKTYVDLNDGTGLQLIDCREIRKSGEVLRIVDGFKADTWVFEIVARVEISDATIATSVKELASV